ncbi:hypothetical protein RUND412_010367 [Rhizina undulata]
MANILGGLFGGTSAKGPAVASNDDFADFSTASTSIESIVSTATAAATTASTPLTVPAFTGPWYAIWERASLSDFKSEGYIILLLIAVISVHLWGTKRNRSIASSVIASIKPVLQKEFAYVGFNRLGKPNTLEKAPAGGTELGSGPGEDEDVLPTEQCLKEISPLEFVSYASGRMNIAFMHTTLKLQRRSNPIAWLGEYVLGFFFESLETPTDTATITISPFDGQDAGKASGHNSKYDNFVWGIVNKKSMKRWREERYDLSLTKTTDWEGLPAWCAVMGESREVGETVLTKDLKEAVEGLEDVLEYLIVTDMPVDKPIKSEEFTPKKRITLHFTLPSDTSDFSKLPALIQAFIRLTDHLVSTAHFRPEVLRKIKATREEEAKKLQKLENEEKAEEREAEKALQKKNERERKLRGMSADEQKRFLEREREKELRKSTKKASRKA